MPAKRKSAQERISWIQVVGIAGIVIAIAVAVLAAVYNWTATENVQDVAVITPWILVLSAIAALAGAFLIWLRIHTRKWVQADGVYEIASDQPQTVIVPSTPLTLEKARAFASPEEIEQLEKQGVRPGQNIIRENPPPVRIYARGGIDRFIHTNYEDMGEQGFRIVIGEHKLIKMPSAIFDPYTTVERNHRTLEAAILTRIESKWPTHFRRNRSAIEQGVGLRPEVIEWLENNFDAQAVMIRKMKIPGLAEHLTRFVWAKLLAKNYMDTAGIVVPASSLDAVDKYLAAENNGGGVELEQADLHNVLDFAQAVRKRLGEKGRGGNLGAQLKADTKVTEQVVEWISEWLSKQQKVQLAIASADEDVPSLKASLWSKQATINEQADRISELQIQIDEQTGQRTATIRRRGAAMGLPASDGSAFSEAERTPAVRNQ